MEVRHYALEVGHNFSGGGIMLWRWDIMLKVIGVNNGDGAFCLGGGTLFYQRWMQMQEGILFKEQDCKI